eukprot:g10017.t1
MPTPRSNIGSVVLQDGTFLTIGGTEIVGGKPHVSTVIEQYFPTTDTWQTWNTSLPTPRANYGGTVYNNKLYLVGGQTKPAEDGNTDSVDILDLKTMEWHSGPALPYTLVGHRVVTLPGSNKGIMVFGGFTYTKLYHRTDYHNDTLILDENGWRKLKSTLPYRVSDFGVAVAKLSNLVYAIGGAMTYPGYAHVAVFEPLVEKWAHAGILNIPRSYAACTCIVDNKTDKESLLVVGGMDGEFRPTNSVEIAQVVSVGNTLNFTVTHDFPIARGAMAAGTVNKGSEVVVVGGTSAYKYAIEESPRGRN